MKQYQEDKINTKIENLKNHLAIVRESVSAESEKLSNIVREYAQTRKLIDSLDKHSVEVNKLLDSRNEALELREDKIKKKEQELRESEVVLNTLISNKRSKLAQEEKEFEIRLKVLVDNINLTTVNFEHLKGVQERDLTRLKRDIEVLEEKIEEATVGLDIVENKVKTKTTELVGLDYELAIRKDELQKITQEIIDSTKTDKVRLLMDSLEAREIAVSKKEKNYLILKGRLSKVLNKLYPGQNIDNLI